MAKTLRAILLGLAGVLIVGATGDFVYTATLKSPTRITGTVTASGIKWTCKGTSCTTSGPWPVPGVGACATLAQQVGEIIAYGHPGAQLSPPDLKTCNANVVASAAPAQTPNIKLVPYPTLPLPQQQKAQQPGPGQQPNQQPNPEPSPSKTPPATSAGFTPKSLRTVALTVTGTGALAPRLPFTPKVVRAPEPLTVTGTGALAARLPFTPKVVHTKTMQVTGTGSLR